MKFHKKINILIFLYLVVPVLAFSAEIGDDGLHKQTWMRDTFKDLREDLEEANQEQKRFMILFEQKGCGYCKKMHEKVYSIPEIASTLQDDFFVIRINIFGDIEVTDFDGETLTEKEIVKKWGVMFTPTVMFFPEKINPKTIASEASVVTMPGAFAKGTTRLLLDWVLLKGYEGEEHLQKFIARNLNNG